MKTAKIACPYCGSAIDQEIGNRKELFCSYCGGKVIIDDEVSRTEHKDVQEKTVNINRNNVSRVVDEAELQKVKNQKFSIKTVLIFGCILAVMMLIAVVAVTVEKILNATETSITAPVSDIEINFKKAVLGKATEETKLIVMEQELSVESEIVKEGLFEWGVFQKNKTITYFGKAIYTVDLKQLRENDIVVDGEKKTLTIYLPEPEMSELIIDPNDFSLGETNKGILSFGDMKFTLEDAFYIEGQAMDLLEHEAQKEELIESATRIANNKIEDLFQKTVMAVDSSYRLIIEMY